MRRGQAVVIKELAFVFFRFFKKPLIVGLGLGKVFGVQSGGADWHLLSERADSHLFRSRRTAAFVTAIWALGPCPEILK